MIYLEIIDEAIQAAAVEKAILAVEQITRPVADRLRLKLVAEFAVQMYGDMQNELGFQPITETTT